MITNGGSSTGTNITLQNMQRQILFNNQQNIHSTEISNNNEISDTIVLGGLGILVAILFALFLVEFINDY